MNSAGALAAAKGSHRVDAVAIDVDGDVITNGAIDERTPSMDRSTALKLVRLRHASMV